MTINGTSPEKLTCCPYPTGYYFNERGECKPIGCKSMQCPYCGKIRKMRILDDLNIAFEDEDKVRFVTLTLRHTDDTRKNRELNRKASKFWAKLRKRLYKLGYTKENLKYFYTVEITKKGMIHYHILWNIAISAGDLCKLWYVCTEKTSWICHVTDTDIYKPSGYMAKYLTKSFEFDIGNKKLKRYGFSRNIKRIKFKPDGKYTYLPKYAYDAYLNEHRTQ